LRDSTCIILWSDHGYQFGERLAFHKFTLWDRALHIPMVFSGPGIEQMTTGEPVSNLDIMPTLLGLFGLAPRQRMDGQDISRFIRGMPQPMRGYAQSVYGVPRKDGEYLTASSVRDVRYRLTQYWRGGLEFFDHETDPYEQQNLMGEKGYKGLRRKYRKAARALQEHLITEFAPAAPHKDIADTQITKSEGNDLPHWAKAVRRVDEKAVSKGNA
jgi:arylsulfatase A-like enzyme